MISACMAYEMVYTHHMIFHVTSHDMNGEKKQYSTTFDTM